MEYSKVGWKDFPDTSTKLNAENLNKMDQGIMDAKEAINKLEKETNELNSNLESLSSFYVDMDTEKITLTGVDSAAIQFQPPKRDGYEPVAAIVRSISGENGAYLVANARTNGWVSVCNCKSITISAVFTIRLFYKKIN